MKTAFAWVLLLGGAAIIAIVLWGKAKVSEKSDVEYLQDAMLEQQAAARSRAELAAELSQKVLSAPESCVGLTTEFVFGICEYEPDPGEDWPDWTAEVDAAEQACLIDAFHQTNAHAFAIQQKPYEPDYPGLNRLSRFTQDLCSASIFTDGVDYGDADASAELLVDGYYADRAESRVRPGQDY